MSKKGWRLVGGAFLVLSLVAVLSLAVADFSEIGQADLKAIVKAEENPSSKVAFKPCTPFLVSTSQHPTKKIDAIPDCLRSG